MRLHHFKLPTSKLIPTSAEFLISTPRASTKSTELNSIEPWQCRGRRLDSKRMAEATEAEFPSWNGKDWYSLYRDTPRYTDVEIQDVEPSEPKAYSTDRLKDIGAAPSQSEQNPEQIAKESKAISKCAQVK